jgi:hypothetical protein
MSGAREPGAGRRGTNVRRFLARSECLYMRNIDMKEAPISHISRQALVLNLWATGDWSQFV